MVETQTYKKIKILRSDDAGEYKMGKVSDHSEEDNIEEENDKL